jgi:hypothetical protein
MLKFIYTILFFLISMGTLDAAHLIATGESALEEVGLTGGQALTVAGSLMSAIGFLGRKVFVMHKEALDEKDILIKKLEDEKHELIVKYERQNEELKNEIRKN